MSEKRKRKSLPANLPNPYMYMMGWGWVSGYFLAWGFLILFSRFTGGWLTAMEMLSSLINGIFLFSVFGTIPGLIIGTFWGAFIKWRLSRYTLTNSWDDDVAPESVNAQ
ncbi:MAG: hypothetical protein AAFV98_17960 [Chloroflexota bacterium]